MQRYIQDTDYEASIHREILDSLIREQPGILEQLEDRGIALMSSYLMQRYDTALLFSLRGGDRHPVVTMCLLDIVIYEAFCIHNPMKMSDIRVKRYDQAMQWLSDITKGVSSLSPGSDGKGGATDYLLPKDELGSNSRFLMSSNPKRENYL